MQGPCSQYLFGILAPGCLFDVLASDLLQQLEDNKDTRRLFSLISKLTSIGDKDAKAEVSLVNFVACACAGYPPA